MRGDAFDVFATRAWVLGRRGAREERRYGEGGDRAVDGGRAIGRRATRYRGARGRREDDARLTVTFPISFFVDD